MEQLLTLSEAAEYLQYSTRQIHRLIRSDPTFPAHRIGGKGHFRFFPNELEEWVKSQPTWLEVNSIPRRGRPCLSGTRPRVIVR
jgi:DNA binding domain, excisionase family